MFCKKCGKEINDEAVVCVHCGCRVKSAANLDGKNVGRFCLTFFLSWLGSFIINHSTLKPDGWKSRSWGYSLWGMLTFGIYPLVASICNLFFDENKPSNIGYFKD